MAKSINTSKEETLIVTQVEETTPASVVEVITPAVNKEEIVAKLGELANIFRTMYGEQLNPVFAEINKSLSNAQYKIMQNL
jgi:hypothetical protein